MHKLDSKRNWVFLVLAVIVFIFSGFQFFWLYISNQEQSLIDVLAIVASLGLIGTLIALSNSEQKVKEAISLQASEREEQNNKNEQGVVSSKSISNDEADEYFSSIKGELHQVERLVSDAVNNLVVNFRYISELTKTHHDMVLAIERIVVPDDSEPIIELLRKQMAVADKIEQELEMAVTSLQFGDLVTQLLAHTSHQIEILNLVLQRIDRQHEQHHAERSMRETHAVISKAVGIATADRKRKPVVQQGMQMGEVELF